MPIESMSFIDVRARLNVAGSTMPLTLGRTQVDALDRLLSALDEKAILYFASGPYILPRLTTEYLPWQGDMTTPPNVTVWFDPGAIITLEGSRLVVLGGMTAPDAQVFAEHGAGMVMFGGELRELFPEWWGAKGEDGVDDTAAIQRAIDAGSARRAPVAVATGIHGGKSRRPIPVTLRRTYRVGGTVVIGRPVPPAPNETIITSFGSLGAVVTSLRGPERPIGGPAAGLRALTPPVGGNPATGASPSDVAMASAVLRLDIAFAARVDNLVIDAAEVMDYALLINSGDNLPVKQTHSIAIQRCDLKGARKVQVQVGPPQVLASMESRNVVGIGKFVPVPAEQVHPGDGDTPGFNLANCLIECPRLATGSLSRGMSFRTANGVGLRVSDSDFRGPTICYVDVTAGMVILEGCDFANPEVETGRGERAPVSVERGFEGPGGEDVYLSAFGVLQGGDVPHLGSGYVAMVSCRSRSATMFGTPDPSPQGLNNGRPNRSSLILGCRHEPPLDFALSTPYSGTSVRWGRLAQGVPRMMHRGGPNYGSDGTLSVVGSYLAGAMRVVTGAAQSVLLATHTATAGNQPEIVPPSRESRVGGTYIRGIITVVFGFQCLALLMLLLATGCHSSAAITPRDVGADLGAPKTADLGGDLPSDGPLDIVRDAPEVEFTQDILDAGAAPDVADLDRSEQPALLDVPSAMDTPTMPPRYIDPEWAMQDVISRDIEVLRAPDAPLVWDFGPARQMRLNCPAVTDGEEGIAAPRLLFPMSPTRVTSQRPTLFWRLPAGVDGARVELCRDRCCTQRIASLDATGSSLRPPTALPPGVVFWRVRGRIGARLGRETSLTWEFGVRHRDAPTDTAWGPIKDFNGDGFDDLFVDAEHAGRAQSRIYWGGADGLHDARFQQFEQGQGAVLVRVGDFNGDGLADLVLKSLHPDGSDAGTTDVSPVLVTYGSRTGPHLGTVRIAAGYHAGAVDDFNGDGFSDFATLGPVEGARGGMPRFSTLILYGGPDGLGSGGEQRFPDPGGSPLRSEYGAHGSCGDLNGDGYAELLVGDDSYERFLGAIYVFEGGPQRVMTPHSVLLRPDPEIYRGVNARFGFQMSLVGDVNGDRVGDLMVGSYNISYRDLHLGGGPQRLTLAQQFLPPNRDQGYGVSSFGGRLYIAPDLNGDGLPEPVFPCSACGSTEPTSPDFERGYVYVHTRGTTSLIDPVPVIVLRGSSDTWDHDNTFGTSIAAGDYDGDGYDDLAVGDIEGDTFTWGRPRGKVYLLFGGPDLGRLRRGLIHGESASPTQVRGIGIELAAIPSSRPQT